MYKSIAIMGKPNHKESSQTLQLLHDELINLGVDVIVEQRNRHEVTDAQRVEPIEKLGELADLAIVVGGDGNMLGAARVLYRQSIKVIGVNRGNLGFLTDLSPDNLLEQLKLVLAGKCQFDNRYLLEVEVERHGLVKSSNAAMNEAVLHPGRIAHMIEFEVYVDDLFMYSQRADGLIVSTPTGSTAYSLSAGGAILSPDLEAIIITPMFAHSLAARPIVLSANSVITIKVAPSQHGSQQISCDGHINLPVMPGDVITIKRSQKALELIHPENRNYYAVLRSKLNWGSKLF